MRDATERIPMLAKASFVFVLLLCALLSVPSPAAANSITMRQLGLKDFEPPIDGVWVKSQPIADSSTAPAFVQSRKTVSHTAPAPLGLGYPTVITSHRKVVGLPYSDAFKLNNTFARSEDGGVDGRLKKRSGYA